MIIFKFISSISSALLISFYIPNYFPKNHMNKVKKTQTKSMSRSGRRPLNSQLFAFRTFRYSII